MSLTKEQCRASVPAQRQSNEVSVSGAPCDFYYEGPAQDHQLTAFFYNLEVLKQQIDFPSYHQENVM